MSDKLLGKKGEAVAARYYLNQGYTLLEHNYQCRLGELDLILQKQELLVFAEVKTRRPGGIELPEVASEIFGGDAAGNIGVVNAEEHISLFVGDVQIA